MSEQPERIWERLAELVTESMGARRVPGVALGVLYRGQTTTGGFGVTSVEHPLPVTDETLFQIGSITKTFVGTAVMRLVERGELDLDAPLRTYVPDFRVADEAASAGATVRHLLTHTGGWAGDFFHATGAGDDALARYVADMAELPQLAPLGTVWSYNNAGFSLAGHVIERVSGKGFEAALKELVLEPLGLDRCFFDAGDVITHRFAVGHRPGAHGAEVARPWPLVRSAYPAGGLVCGVRDLLRYARLHLGHSAGDSARVTQDGGPLLSPESLDLMQSPQAIVWEREAWGLSWAIKDIAATRQVGHGGGTTGQVTLLTLVPQHGFALAVLTNSEQGEHVTQDVRRWALRGYLGVEDPKPVPLQAGAEELARFAGRYEGFYSDLELGMLAGRLVGQVRYKRSFPSEDVPPSPAPPPMSLDLCAKDRLLVLDGESEGETADVIRREDGSIGWLRASGRLHVRMG